MTPPPVHEGAESVVGRYATHVGPQRDLSRTCNGRAQVQDEVQLPLVQYLEVDLVVELEAGPA